MHFMERLFGLSPDGGSGQYEATLVIIVLSVCVVLALARRRFSRR